MHEYSDIKAFDPNGVYTIAQWQLFRDEGNPVAIAFFNSREAVTERYKIRIPVAYKQEDMLPEIREAYQNLSNFLGQTVYATGSSIRGYWRTPEEENAIVEKYGLECPKYSDLDFWCDINPSKEQIANANKTIVPPAPFSIARWERCVIFYPKT